MALTNPITALIDAVNNFMGVVDGKLRNKANSADVYSRAYLDSPANTIGGNAATASKLQTARTFALGGDATGSVTFDGGANVTLTVSVPALADKADAADTLTTEEVDARIQAVIGAAPDALDTLNEIAAALGDNPNFATTMTTELGKKANKLDVYGKTTADGRFLAIGAQAADAAKLGGQLPSHYATAQSVADLETEVASGFNQLAQAFNDGAALINGTNGA